MKKLSILFLTSILFISSLTSVLTYKVDLPSTQPDSRINETTISSDNKEYYKDISKKVNDFLWFILWTVSFAAVVYAGFLLMSSNWSDEDLKKANKILTWWLIWIFVSLLSYIIVKLLIGLF